jgi:hypothetical protein
MPVSEISFTWRDQSVVPFQTVWWGWRNQWPQNRHSIFTCVLNHCILTTYIARIMTCKKLMFDHTNSRLLIASCQHERPIVAHTKPCAASETAWLHEGLHIQKVLIINCIRTHCMNHHNAPSTRHKLSHTPLGMQSWYCRSQLPLPFVIATKLTTTLFFKTKLAIAHLGWIKTNPVFKDWLFCL